MLVADEPEVAAGLLLFSYPLHPPGKPERRRTEHFPRLKVPCVFVQGSADPFGGADELGPALALIPSPTRLFAIPGAGHDLKRGRFDLTTVVAAVLDGGRTLAHLSQSESIRY
jgi:predicted alpha/beta-hydrolase family hydrolase